MWISGYQSIRLLDIRGTGSSEIVHAPNLKNKIGAGSPCTIRCRVYAHSELEKFWRKSDPPCRSHGEAGAIQHGKSEKNSNKDGMSRTNFICMFEKIHHNSTDFVRSV